MSDTRLAPPINGAELRLELILEELRGIRAALHQAAARPPQASTDEPRPPRVLGNGRSRSQA